MSAVRAVRALVEQRLTAAAEEIFGLFERTIAEYEEELCRSKEENERQQKLLDAVFNPQLQLHRADVQQLLEVKEEVPSEQQERSSSLDQEDPEPPHIKEEQEELWSSQEGEQQLQGLEEADITKSTFTPVPVKSEDDEEKPQSSQLHHTQTEAAGEDCGGPGPHRDSGPGPGPGGRLQPVSGDEALDSSETEDPQKTSSVSVCETGRAATKRYFICPQCGKAFVSAEYLQLHMEHHTEKTLTCPFCSKMFTKRSNLKRHLRVHTGEKPFSCSVCNRSFSLRLTLVNHMKVHAGEKPLSCSLCHKRFSRRGNLTTHLARHAAAEQLTCSVCGITFTWQSQLREHTCAADGGRAPEETHRDNISVRLRADDAPLSP